jgi:hypothetical protein
VDRRRVCRRHRHLLGITAWETHQDRVNTEVIYCTLFSGIETDDDGEPRTLTDQQQRLADQLGC